MNSDKEYFLPNIYKNGPQESNTEMCFGCDYQYKLLFKFLLNPFFLITDELGRKMFFAGSQNLAIL